jgi:hypothetical protein
MFNQKEYMREYNQRPEVKARRKILEQSSEYKAIRRAYTLRPEYKAQMKAYSRRPEYKAQKKAYNRRPEVKARKKIYYERPEVRARINESALLRTRIKALRAIKLSERSVVQMEKLSCFERLYELHFIEKKDGLPVCVLNGVMVQAIKNECASHRR